MINSELLSKISFRCASIILEGDQRNTEIDLGGINLSHQGREYALDITQSFRHFEGGETTIECLLEHDEEALREIFTCNFNVTPTDIIDMKDGEIYITGDFDEILNMYLVVKYKELTKIINLKAEE